MLTWALRRVLAEHGWVGHFGRRKQRLAKMISWAWWCYGRAAGRGPRRYWRRTRMRTSASTRKEKKAQQTKKKTKKARIGNFKRSCWRKQKERRSEKKGSWEEKQKTGRKQATGWPFNPFQDWGDFLKLHISLWTRREQSHKLANFHDLHCLFRPKYDLRVR